LTRLLVIYLINDYLRHSLTKRIIVIFQGLTIQKHQKHQCTETLPPPSPLAMCININVVFYRKNSPKISNKAMYFSLFLLDASFSLSWWWGDFDLEYSHFQLHSLHQQNAQITQCNPIWGVHRTILVIWAQLPRIKQGKLEQIHFHNWLNVHLSWYPQKQGFGVYIVLFYLVTMTGIQGIRYLAPNRRRSNTRYP